MQTSLQKHIRWMVGLLALEFVLGMTMNLWGVPPDERTPEHTAPLFASVAFFAHAILGLGLLIGAVFILRLSLKSGNQTWKKSGMYGLLSILLAFAGGILTLALREDAREISSFVMSLGFLLSFFSYGRYYYQTQT